MHIEILYAMCLAYVWVHVLQVPYWFKAAFNFKPINCEVCMSGWFCLCMTVTSYAVIEVVGMMGVAMIGEVLLNGLIRRL